MKQRSLRTDDSIDEVIGQYSDMVYRIAFARTQSKYDADEIYQEVFLRYIQKQPRFQEEEHRKAWLIRVTINCSKKLWAQAWRHKTVPLDESLSCELPEDCSLYEQLAKLPPNYREVLHLYYYEDLSVNEMSQILHRKSSTIRTQLTRARALLKPLCEEEIL